MHLHSTKLAAYKHPPPPPSNALPKLLSALSDAKLQLHFERFAYFVWTCIRDPAKPGTIAAGKTTSLTAAIYREFISKLVKVGASLGPQLVADVFNDRHGVAIRIHKCQFKSTASFADAVTSTYDSLPAGPPQNDFQLFLYIALNHFVVWYCTDFESEPLGARAKSLAKIDDFAYQDRDTADTKMYGYQLEPSEFKPPVGYSLCRVKRDADGTQSLWGLTVPKVINGTVIPAVYERLPAEYFVFQRNQLGRERATINSVVKIEIQDQIRSFLVGQGMSATDALDVRSDWFVLESTLESLRTGFDLKFGTLGRVNLKAFRNALAKMVQLDVKSILRTLVRTAPNGGPELSSSEKRSLLDGYGEFNLFGFGNGSDTTGMFGLKNYGLLFFDYEIVEPDGMYKLTLVDPLLAVGRRAHTACIFYLGLDRDYTADPLDPGPSVEITDGSTRKVFHAQDNRSYELSPPVSAFRLSSIPGATFMDLTLRTNRYLNNGTDRLTGSHKDEIEEIVFIVFRHAIGSPSASHISLQSERTYGVDNAFGILDTEFEPFVSVGLTAKTVEDLVALLVADPSFEIQSYAIGKGIGMAAKDPALPGCDFSRRPNAEQIDGPPASEGVALRYSFGTVDYYADQVPPVLRLDTVGFVSPVVCTWFEFLLLPDGTTKAASLLQSEVGVHLGTKTGKAVSYNCALSAFRAFGMLEGMINRIIARAEATVPAAKAKVLREKLEKHLQVQAYARLTLPNGTFPEGSGPGGEFVVTYNLVHKFRLP